MSDEEINAMIHRDRVWREYDGPRLNYCKSLDAIMDAVWHLSPEKANKWADELEKIVMVGANPHWVRAYAIAMADAKARALAFIKTI